jgi:hypothetical protein
MRFSHFENVNLPTSARTRAGAQHAAELHRLIVAAKPLCVQASYCNRVPRVFMVILYDVGVARLHDDAKQNGNSRRMSLTFHDSDCDASIQMYSCIKNINQ